MVMMVNSYSVVASIETRLVMRAKLPHENPLPKNPPKKSYNLDSLPRLLRDHPRMNNA